MFDGSISPSHNERHNLTLHLRYRSTLLTTPALVWVDRRTWGITCIGRIDMSRTTCDRPGEDQTSEGTRGMAYVIFGISSRHTRHDHDRDEMHVCELYNNSTDKESVKSNKAERRLVEETKALHG